MVRAKGGGNEPLSVTRRAFLGGAGALVVGTTLAPGWARADATAGGLANVRGGNASPELFVRLEPDGSVALTCHRSEMGQQVWTAMAQIIADEMEARWERVSVVQAEGHPRYGDQNTDGSRSVRRNLHRLRVTGAAMRHMLEAAAAKRWGVPLASVRAEQHEVVHSATGRRLSYGELARAASQQPLPSEESVRLKSRAEWRYIGKAVPSLTVPSIVRGEGTFGYDVSLPGMLYAVVARPPQVFGKIAELDDTAARAVPGVVNVIRLPELEPPPVLFRSVVSRW